MITQIERIIRDGLANDPDFAVRYALWLIANRAKYGTDGELPPFVPRTIRLPDDVHGELPFGPPSIARAGAYTCQSNRWGAVFVVADNGKDLGVKPDEFEILSWEANPAIARNVRKELPEDHSDYCVERDNERLDARDSELARRDNSP